MMDTKAGAYCFCLLLLCLLALPVPVAAGGLLPGPPAAVRIDFTAEHISVTAIQGYSNRSTGRALMPDDPVRIASVSKLFVALGVMRLVENGTLRLRSEEHTSELQSRSDLVCRLLLDKKKKKTTNKRIGKARTWVLE